MTKNYELKERLEEIRDFICDTIEDRGYPPTIRELCVEFDIKSTSSAAYYLRKLEDAGELKINRLKSRGIEISSDRRIPKDMTNVPLVGSITAGTPKLAYEECEDNFLLPNNLFNCEGKEVFMLTVIGTSMVDVGINDGDLILVKKQDTARNGQIVAALIDGETATVKRYFNENGRVRLHPENRYMPDLYPTDVAILGIVIGLVRTNIK